MNIYSDERIVMTLDAGGTNLVFSAMQAGTEIVSPITLPSQAHDLKLCLSAVIKGFEEVKSRLKQNPVAISFAFPGPANYKAGVIGNLPNFPAFGAKGVALGPMLEDYFKVPTFIANDGDLFTYGESIAGLLPFVNEKLRENNVPREYKNLIGVTLGTGFGGGLVVNGNLCQGDNSGAGEIWLSRNFKNTRIIAEESVSIRAIQRAYASQVAGPLLTPKEIYEIAMGTAEGNQQVAKQAFSDMATVIAESLSNAVTLIDGLIVIGGGLSGSYSLLIPTILEHMNGTIEGFQGEKYPRIVSSVYNLEDTLSMNEFLQYETTGIQVPFSDRVVYDTLDKRIAIGESRLGTSKAVAIGAYAIALQKLATIEKKDKIFSTL